MHPIDLPVTLAPLTEEDREAFIRENQAAFRYGAMEEFGLLDDSADEDGEVISRAAIERCLDAPDREAYRILCGGRRVGGAVLRIDARTHRNELELLFVAPSEHNRGIGGVAWRALEALHPETAVWETCTPYFDVRNLHFYINKCGFRAVEFFCGAHPDPLAQGGKTDPFFRFEKRMK